MRLYYILFCYILIFTLISGINGYPGFFSSVKKKVKGVLQNIQKKAENLAGIVVANVSELG